MLLQLFVALSICYSTQCGQYSRIEMDQQSHNPFYMPIFNQSQKVTILTFYIQQEVTQPEDYIEVDFVITEKDKSLKKAINSAKSIIDTVKKTVGQFCTSYGGTDCEDRIDIGNHNILPYYQLVRKQPLFKEFVVKYDVKLIVKEIEAVGDIFDTILYLGIDQIKSFEWKPFEEVDAEQVAINSGLAQAQKLCTKINRRMGQILAIEEIMSQEEDEDEDGGKQVSKEDEEEDEDKPSVLKFQVECIGKFEINEASDDTEQTDSVKKSSKTKKPKKSKEKKK